MSWRLIPGGDGAGIAHAVRTDTAYGQNGGVTQHLTACGRVIASTAPRAVAGVPACPVCAGHRDPTADDQLALIPEARP